MRVCLLPAYTERVSAQLVQYVYLTDLIVKAIR